MSSDSYESYRKSAEDHTLRFAADPKIRKKAEEDYVVKVASARSTVTEKKEKVVRDKSGLYDVDLVKLGFTHPKPGIKRVHIVLTDNSGSNRRIAEHQKESSGYIMANLSIIDPESQLAINYFSDHCDGKNIQQIADFVTPDKEGDKTLFSTTQHIDPAGGGDAPEAIECALWDVCKIDFGDATEKHLYLVTDVVAHGMGLAGDDGCPAQRDWRRSLEEVAKTFTSFSVIGCGDDARVGELQKQFIAKDRLQYDLIDLSEIRDINYRLGITVNSVLFLIARTRGMQTVELFLGSLYEKWLKEPLFGANTDLAAKEAIRRFAKYLEAPKADIDKMLSKILA
jgi:hypothetical protein